MSYHKNNAMKIKTQLVCAIVVLMGMTLSSCSADDVLQPADAEKSSLVIKSETVTEFETATQAVANMKIGWNLGNTLESNSNEVDGWIEKYTDRSVKSYETAWGQPQADAHLMAAFKTMGFNAIRVPVTWWPHLDNDTIVDAKWMARVKEVVDYVLAQNMYCIVNVHHDTGSGASCWMKADLDNFDKHNAKFVKIWQQIAQTFRDYDQRLLFEGYNEMLDAGDNWNAPADRNDLKAINQYAQSFVNTVRASGGNNAKRNLIVSTYAAATGGTWGNTPYVMKDFVVPTDPIGNQNHLAVEVHAYSPWQWMKSYSGKWTSQCESAVRDIFVNYLKPYVLDKGYPAVLGEYGPSSDGMEDGAYSNEDKYELPQMARCYIKYCKQYGVAPFYWMGLVDGSDRAQATFKWSMPKTTDAIVNEWYGDGNEPSTTTGIHTVTK